MCPRVGPHVPSFEWQLCGLPSRVEYLSPQGVLLPLVYGTTASPLWPELRGLSAWQATPSWTVYRMACHRLLPWLWVTFAMVPGACLAVLGPAASGYRPCCWPAGSAGLSPCVRPMGCWLFPVPRPPFVCTRVRCPGPPGSRSPVCRLGALLCVCVVLRNLAPVHRCARSVRCFAGTVSWATWPLFTGVPARCVASLVRCPGALGSCSPVCQLSVLCCLCGVLGHVAPVYRCARSVHCFACAVSWASWLLFTGVPARCVVLRVRCPGPLGPCSPVCPLGVLCCCCCFLGHLAPIRRCARSVCCVACAVSWASGLLVTGLPARCVVLRVRCPGPLGSCSPLCPLGVLCCVCGVLGHLAPVHRCAGSVCCVACALPCATWLLFTCVPTLCVAFGVRCPWPLGSCSQVCPLGALLCICGVLGPLAPVHRCARWVRCVGCAASSATWLLFTGVLARCVVLWVACAVLRVRGVSAGRTLSPSGAFLLRKKILCKCIFLHIVF